MIASLRSLRNAVRVWFRVHVLSRWIPLPSDTTDASDVPLPTSFPYEVESKGAGERTLVFLRTDGDGFGWASDADGYEYMLNWRTKCHPFSWKYFQAGQRFTALVTMTQYVSEILRVEKP